MPILLDVDDVDRWRSAGRALERLQSPLASEMSRVLTAESAHLRGQAPLLLGYLTTAVALRAPEVLGTFLHWLLPMAGDSAEARNAFVSRIATIGDLVASQLPDPDRALVRDVVRRALDHAGIAHEAPIPVLAPPTRQLLAAFLAGDRPGARRIAVSELEKGLAHLYEEVVTPALREIGRLWYERRISVAQEHLASALAQATIASLYPLIDWPTGGPRAVVACVGGEQHALGARMTADLLGLDGWDVTFLGPDVPTDALVELLRSRPPKLVALSITLALQLSEARSAIASIRASLPGVRIMLGGRGTAHATSLETDVVAESASQGVALAARWKS